VVVPALRERRTSEDTELTALHKIIAGSVAIVFGFGTGAFAQTEDDSIQVRFSGKVVETRGVSDVPVGTPVSGEYRFRSDAKDFNPADPALGLYEAVLEFRLTVGPHEYEAESGTIGVLNDSTRFGGRVDAYTVTSGPPLVGPKLSDLPPFQVDMNLADSTASVFASVELPLDIDAASLDILGPRPGLQTGGHLLFRDSASGKTGDVGFLVDKLEVVPRAAQSN
jgi:hypothetical protein